MACARRRYQWRYVYGFVHPKSGRTEWCIGTTVSVEAMSGVLEHFARQVGAGPDKRVVVVWDGAGWHSSKLLRVPEGLHLVQLPPYSPELQPAECVWPLIHEVLANRDFEDMEHLERVLGGRCRQLAVRTDLVRGRAGFWWWPGDVL